MLAFFTLNWAEYKSILFVTLYDELNTGMAELTNTVKKDYGRIVS